MRKVHIGAAARNKRRDPVTNAWSASVAAEREAPHDGSFGGAGSGRLPSRARAPLRRSTSVGAAEPFRAENEESHLRAMISSRDCKQLLLGPSALWRTYSSHRPISGVDRIGDSAYAAGTRRILTQTWEAASWSDWPAVGDRPGDGAVTAMSRQRHYEFYSDRSPRSPPTVSIGYESALADSGVNSLPIVPRVEGNSHGQADRCSTMDECPPPMEPANVAELSLLYPLSVDVGL